MSNKEVIIMRGLPGSGKSTWLKKNNVTVIYSADHYFMTPEGEYKFDPARLGLAHKYCLGAFISALQSQVEGPIAVDNTNISVEEIAPYWRVAEAFDYVPRIVSCVAPIDVCAQRNIHGVSLEVIKRMWSRRTDLPPWMLARASVVSMEDGR